MADDKTPPALTSFVLPARVGVGGTFNLAVGASDSGTGVLGARVYLDKALLTENTYNAQIDQTWSIGVSGTDSTFSNGTAAASTDLSAYTPGGMYTVAGVSVMDRAYNQSYYSADQLRAMGFNTTISIPTGASDTTPPAVLDLTLPTHVDLAARDAVVKVGLSVTDGGTGVAAVQIVFDRPLATAGYGATDAGKLFSFWSDPRDPTSFSRDLTISRYAAEGSYGIEALIVRDGAGNLRTYSAEELGHRTITVSGGTPDTAPPTLTSLTLPSGIDVSRPGAVLSAAATAQDDGSGASRFLLELDRPVVRQYSDGASASSFLSGSLQPGQVSDSLPLSPWTAPGTYAVSAAYVYDKIGNATSYSQEQLEALGFRTTFTVTGGTADTTKPVLTSLSLPTIDLTRGGTFATFEVGGSDEGSGLATIDVELTRPLATTYGFGGVDLRPDSTFTFSDFDQGTEPKYRQLDPRTTPGTYGVRSVEVTDRAGNVARYGPEDLALLGFQTSFEVTGNASDRVGPVLTSLSLPQPLQLGPAGAEARFAIGAYDEATAIHSATIRFDREIVATTVDSSSSLTFHEDAEIAIYNGDLPHLPRQNGPGPLSLDTTYTLSTLSSPGFYNVVDVELWDNHGNVTLYSAEALRGLGFQTSFQVADAPRPHGPPSGDFDGDRRSDLLWRHDDGTYATWQMNGATPRLNVQAGHVDPSWAVAATGDWNGDGRADLLWRNPEGVFATWEMNGATANRNVLLVDWVGPEWKVKATGDYNGDGRDDLLWRHDDGTLSLWNMNGAAPTLNTFTAHVPTAWRIVGSGDFDGDGTDDLLWRNEDGTLTTWDFTSNRPTEGLRTWVDPYWHVIGTGDFNGDARDDILWRNDDGLLTTWEMDGGNARENAFTTWVDPSWKVADIGDYDGDGRDDLAWRHESGLLATWHMGGSTAVQNVLVTEIAPTAWAVVNQPYDLV